MTIIAENGFIFIALAMAFGLFMTWGIGANDVANAMGTSVGSGAIRIRHAILIAAIFEFAGAAIAGGHVTKTIRKGIIDPSLIADEPQLLIFGMLAFGGTDIMGKEGGGVVIDGLEASQLIADDLVQIRSLAADLAAEIWFTLDARADVTKENPDAVSTLSLFSCAGFRSG